MNEIKRRSAIVVITSVLLLGVLALSIGLGSAQSNLSETLNVSYSHKLVPDNTGDDDLAFPYEVVAVGPDRVWVSDHTTMSIKIFDTNGQFIDSFGYYTGCENVTHVLGMTKGPDGRVYAADSGEHYDTHVVTVWDVGTDGKGIYVKTLPIDARYLAFDPEDGTIWASHNYEPWLTGATQGLLHFTTDGEILDEVSWPGEEHPIFWCFGVAVYGDYVFVGEIDYGNSGQIRIYDKTNLTKMWTMNMPEAGTDAYDFQVDLVNDRMLVSVFGFKPGVVTFPLTDFDPENPPTPNYLIEDPTGSVFGVTNAIGMAENGDIYVVDRSKLQVHRFSSDGTYILSFPDQSEITYKPQGIEMLPDGTVLLADMKTNSIYSMDINGENINKIVELERRMGWSYLKADALGNIFIKAENVVVVYGPDGSGPLAELNSYNTTLTTDPITNELIVDGMREFFDVETFTPTVENENHYLYVLESNGGWPREPTHGAVIKLQYDLDTWTFTEVWTRGNWMDNPEEQDFSQDKNVLGPNTYMQPCGAAYHTEGYLFVIDGAYWRVNILNASDGTWLGEFGCPILPEGTPQYTHDVAHELEEDPAMTGKLLMPIDIDIEPVTGNLFVVNHIGTVKIYTKTGEFTQSFGEEGILPGQLFGPLAIAIGSTDQSRFAIVTDEANRVPVWKISEIAPLPAERIYGLARHLEAAVIAVHDGVHVIEDAKGEFEKYEVEIQQAIENIRGFAHGVEQRRAELYDVTESLEDEHVEVIHKLTGEDYEEFVDKLLAYAHELDELKDDPIANEEEILEIAGKIHGHLHAGLDGPPRRMVRHAEALGYERPESGKEILWEYDAGAVFVQHLENGNTLITGDKRVIEVTPDKEIVWEYPAVTFSARRLPNGNTLIAGDFGRPTANVTEVTPDKTILWQYRGDFIPSGADRLPNGNTVIADPKYHRVFEVTPDKEIVWEYTDLVYMWKLQVLPNGNMLTIETRDTENWTATRVVEITRDKEIVWEYTDLFDSPFGYAQRLPNGNTVIADSDRNRKGYPRIIEVTPYGEIVWEYTDIDLTYPCGVHRSENGNTVIADSSFPRAIEVGIP